VLVSNIIFSLLCYLASAKSCVALSYDTFLSWFASFIDGENVRIDLRILDNDTADESSKIDDMNSRH